METLQEPITALPDVPRCPLCGGTMERTTDSQGRTLWLCDACWIWMDDQELARGTPWRRAHQEPL